MSALGPEYCGPFTCCGECTFIVALKKYVPTLQAMSATPSLLQ